MEKKEIYHPTSNRIGKFNLSYQVLADGEFCKALFSLCHVIEAGEHESGRGREYIAASELFEALKENEEVPEYRIELAYNEPFKDPDWEKRRLGDSKFGFVAIRNTIVRVPPAQMFHHPRVIH